MLQAEDLDFVSKEAARTKLRQSYFAHYVGEAQEVIGGPMLPVFVYGEEAKRLRELNNELENNDKDR